MRAALQVLAESTAQVEKAYQYIAQLRIGWPECMQGIKTAQLAQEMLMYKEGYISELGQTGDKKSLRSKNLTLWSLRVFP